MEAMFTRANVLPNARMVTGMNCMHLRLGCVAIATVLSLGAQEQNPPANPAPEVKQSASPADDFLVPAGTAHNAKNTGKTVAKVLGTYIVEKGKPLATPVQ